MQIMNSDRGWRMQVQEMGRSELTDVHAVREMWGKWLAELHPWSHFLTLTFASETSPDLAIRHFRRWLRWVEQRAQCRVAWFYVVERGGAPVVHLHVLIAGTSRLAPRALREAWKHGRAQAAIYAAGGRAASYVTKTLGCPSSEYDLDGRQSWRRW
jgi:hypothetical protein